MRIVKVLTLFTYTSYVTLANTLDAVIEQRTNNFLTYATRIRAQIDTNMRHNSRKLRCVIYTTNSIKISPTPFLLLNDGSATILYHHYHSCHYISFIYIKLIHSWISSWRMDSRSHNKHKSWYTKYWLKLIY